MNLRGGQSRPEQTRRRLGELNELAARYCGVGRFAEALPLFEDVVAGCRDTLGAEDPDTLISEGNLVVTQLRLDPGGPALTVLDEHVEVRRRVLGPRHPATMTARHAQAAAHESAGHIELSVALFAAVLDERTRVLGSTHPDTVASRLGFGLATAEAGDLVGAATVLEQALHDSDLALGPQHRLGQLLRAGLDDLYAALDEQVSAAGDRPSGNAPEAEDHPRPHVPAPRRPRGARFHGAYDEPAPEPVAEPASAPKSHPPRGARFRRG